MEHDGEMEALGETSSGALRTAIVAPRRCVAARRTATAGLAEARMVTLRTDRAVGQTVRGTRRRARTARGGSPRYLFAHGAHVRVRPLAMAAGRY